MLADAVAAKDLMESQGLTETLLEDLARMVTQFDEATETGYIGEADGRVDQRPQRAGSVPVQGQRAAGWWWSRAAQWRCRPSRMFRRGRSRRPGVPEWAPGFRDLSG